MTRTLLAVAIVAGGFGFCATSASASPVTISFTGVVDGGTGPLSGLYDGMTLTGTYVFESTTSPRPPGSDPRQAVYDPLLSLSFSFDSAFQGQKPTD